MEHNVDDPYLVELWEDYIDQYCKVYKSNIKLEAIIYARLGSMFSLVEKSPDNLFFNLFRKKNQLRNPKLAIKFLERSIALNKNDKDVYINLLRVYEHTNEKSKINRLLDTMIKLFPEDKNILFRAGTACINRSVYVKGIKYLEMALKLDNLDHTIKERLIIGYINLAKSYFIKNKAPAGRNSFQKAIELGTPELSDFIRGQAYLYARWAALEFAYGSEEIGGKNIAKLPSFNVEQFPLQYFTILYFKVVNVPLSNIAGLEKEVDDILKESSTSEMALQLQKTIFFIRQLGKFQWLGYEKKRINSYSIKAATNKNDKCTRKLAKEIVQIIIKDKVKSLYNSDYSVATAYIKKMLAIDKYDPLFLFYAYLIKYLGFKIERDKNDKNFLKCILLLAERRKETELMKEIKREIDFVEKLLINPFFGKNASNVNFKDKDIADNELFSTIDNYCLKALDKIVSDSEFVSKKNNVTKNKAENNIPKRNPKYEQLEFFQDLY